MNANRGHRQSLHAKTPALRPRWRIWVVALSAAFFCEMAGSVPGPGDWVAQAGAAPVVVTFETDYLPNGKYVPFVYGKSLGYFKQEGINLVIKYGRGSATTADAVAQGKVDVGMVDSGVTAIAIDRGEPLVSVGLYTGRNTFAFWVPSSSSIKSIAELKGKRLIVSPGSPQSVVAPAVLRLAGLKKGDVTFVTVSAALADSTYAHNKASEAIGEAVNFAPIFQKIRPSRALPWSDVGYKMPGFSFVVSKSELAAHPDVVARFLKATYRSIVASLKDPDAAARAYGKSQPTLSMALITPEWKLLKHYFCSEGQIDGHVKLGEQVQADWDAGLAILEKTKVLPKAIGAGDVYSNEMFGADHNVSAETCVAEWGPK